MPAFVKSKVGSPCGTSGELDTRRWPRSSKKRRNASRISSAESANGPPGAGNGGRRIAWGERRAGSLLRPSLPCGSLRSPFGRLPLEPLNEAVVLGLLLFLEDLFLGLLLVALEVVPGRVGGGGDA